MTLIQDTIRDSFDSYIEAITATDNIKANLVTTSFTFIFLTLTITKLFSLFAQLEYLTLVKYALIISGSISLLAGVMIHQYPRMQISSKNRSIKETLLNTISYMSVLASSGMAIDRIMAKVAKIEKNRYIQSEVQIFLTDIKLFGKPVGEALEDMSNRTENTTFSKIMFGIVNTINTSGDLTSYLGYETKQLITLKEEETKDILTKLSYMGEVYIAALVVGPILFIIMLSLLAGLNISTGLSSMVLLNSMVFIAIPLLSTGFLVVLDYVMGGLD